MIYLDNAATTKPCKEAIIITSEVMEKHFSNPSSLHGLGLDAERVVEKARNEIASSLGVNSECIYFTSGATESNNLSIFGTAKTLGRHKKKIITTAIEHPSISQPLKYLSENGFEVVSVLPNENGEIEPNDILKEIDENTCLVTIQLVNNETGYVLPVSKIFKAVERINPKVIKHCDCVQGFMKLDFKAKDLGADLISLSGHKVYGPKGIGALFVKKSVRLLPYTYGGGQEKGLRSGTEATQSIAGFGEAVRVNRDTISKRYEKVLEVYKYLATKASEIERVKLNEFSSFSPYIASLTVYGIKAETLLHYLEQKDIYVSSGSACSKGKKSEVLKAFNYDEKALDSTIRLSFSASNTKDEIDIVIEEIKNAQKELCHI